MPTIGKLSALLLGTASLAAVPALLGAPRKSRASRWLIAVLACLAALGVWQYLGFSRFGSPRFPFVHVHEFAHYYLNGKFFRELGYDGLYVCIATALRDLAEEERVPRSIAIGSVTDLRDKKRLLRGGEIYREAGKYLSRFPPGRWEAFKSDVASLVWARPRQDWQEILSDAGFRPSPAWTVWGFTVANAVPFRPWLYFLSSIDLAILAGAAAVLWSLVGSAAALTFLCVFAYFPVGLYASYNWTGGSFMRYTWLFWLILAWACLRRGRFLLSGLAFGASSMERIFPVLFFLAALAPGAWERLRDRVAGKGAHAGGRASPAVIPLAAGFALSSAALLLVSAALFGWESWTSFLGYIRDHGRLYFWNHVGLRRAGVFTPETAAIAATGLPAGLEQWYEAMARRWEMWPLNQAVFYGMTASAFLASLRMSPLASSLLLGGVLAFSTTMPAHYYLVYLSGIMAMIAGGSGGAPEGGAIRSWAPLAIFLASSNLVMLGVKNTVACFSYVSILLLAAWTAVIILSLCRSVPRSLAILAALVLAGGLVGLQRSAPLDNRVPPPAVGGEAVKLAFVPGAGAISLGRRTLTDTYGNVVRDEGASLPPGGSLEASFILPRAAGRKIMIRSDRRSEGYLTLVLNGGWGRSFHVRVLGDLFDYLTVPVPAAALRPGANTVSLRWTGEAPLEIYSTWLL